MNKYKILSLVLALLFSTQANVLAFENTKKYNYNNFQNDYTQIGSNFNQNWHTQPIPQNNSQNLREYNSIDCSDLNAIEKYLLNKNYKKESNIERIERLELATFGAIQYGDIFSRYKNVRQIILQHPKPNYRTSFLKGMQNYFLGEATGFTPEIINKQRNNYNNIEYPTNYTNQNNIEYSRPFGHGFRTNSFDTGNYSRVTILD